MNIGGSLSRALFVALVVSVVGAGSLFAGTLESVKKKGYVNCGVSTGLAGFSSADSSGKWKGLDVDVCRAISAAIFGDPDKVKYVPLTAKERFTALQSSEIDVLSRNTTWTHTRDTSLGLNFAGVSYYDGVGFLVSKKLGINSARELDGANICIQTGTTTELVVADYFGANNMSYKSTPYDTSDQTRLGFEKGRCDVLVSDQSQLYSLRIKLKNPSGAIVLPEVVSKEPLGPVVRQGDDIWFNIVKWSLNALIAGEERGITSKNVDSLKASSKNPAVRRILGVDGKLGANLGLSKDWSYNILKYVGNYGEIFDENVGSGSALKIKRTTNKQWKDGGLLYSPPFR